MTSAVLDTNVVVSAHIQPAGIPARILLLAFANEFKIYVSSSIVTEYDDVLRRPKFKIKSEIVDGFLKTVSTTATAVEPTTMIRAAKDPDDDKFLECAFAVQADYLVTGNLKDYPTATPRGFSGHDAMGKVIEGRTRIVSPREFLQAIES